MQKAKYINFKNYYNLYNIFTPIGCLSDVVSDFHNEKQFYPYKVFSEVIIHVYQRRQKYERKA